MTELKKSLSTIRGTGLFLNIVIGAGLLALPGLVFEMVGNHSLWAWGLCALISAPLLLSFIIMGRRYPNAGGIAHFSEIAFGPYGYAVSSLLFLGAVSFGLPAIALTGGHYITGVLPGHPAMYGAALIIAGALIHLLSTELAGRISTIVSSIILISLFGITLLGFSAIEWDNFVLNTAPIEELNISLLFMPFMIIFFAFTGWEVASGLAEEFKNPKRDFPRAMIASFIVACIIYFLMAFVVQSVPFAGSKIASFSSIAEVAVGMSGKYMIVILTGVIIFANLMGAIWAVSRMVFSLSREHYIPLKLKTTASGSPLSAVAITTVVLLMVLLLDWLGILDIKKMLALAGQNFLILYGITASALLKLSEFIFEKLIAIVVLIIVISLIYMQGILLIYPVSLAAVGLILGRFTRLSRKEP